MRAPRRRTLATATVSVTTALLVGCSGQSTAASSTPSSDETAAGSTPSATVTPPPPPHVPDDPSPEGASGMAQYFFDLYPYVMATGDTFAWDRMSHPDCGYCTQVGATYAAAPDPERALSVASGFDGITETEAGARYTVELALSETGTDGTTAYFTALVDLVREAGHPWLVREVQVDEVTPNDG